MTTTGRRTGRARTVAVGYVAEPDGSVLVAATDPEAAWADNLEADPHCTVEIGDRRFAAMAERLEQREHGRAIRDLILRYGTPSEGLGRGASFRLRPVGDG